MSLIIVRYAEMGLKSRPVRSRFERILLDNMMDALAVAGTEGLISSDYGRIYVRTDDEETAMEAISRVFGVSSLSPVVECRATMEETCNTAAEFSRALIRKGGSFAVRARREGVHDFTSMDLNREMGSAIWTANEEKGVRVDLQDPDVEIFVEVRGSRAFIFHRIVQGPGGLPLGSQGKVVAFVSDKKHALAVWLMMKRGCRVAVLTEDSDLGSALKKWDPNLRVEPPSNRNYMIQGWGALGCVYGFGFGELDRVLTTSYELPAFFPLVGMEDQEIQNRLEAIMA